MRQDAGAPTLAGCAGEYRERRPAAPLARHFRCMWLHTLPPDHEGPVAVVPDGCVDLLWIEGRLAVAGPDETAALATLSPGATVAGIRFRPGAAVKWLGLPMSEIVGRRVDLRDLWGRRADDLADGIGDAASPSDGLKRLEAGLVRLAPSVDRPTPDMEFLFRLLGAPAADPGLSAIRDRLDISERGLRRRCHEAFGYGPKTLDRILRFQRFLNLVRHPGRASLSVLAHEAGYADQAHLTREVRRLSGLSPSMILRQFTA